MKICSMLFTIGFLATSPVNLLDLVSDNNAAIVRWNATRDLSQMERDLRRMFYGPERGCKDRRVNH